MRIEARAFVLAIVVVVVCSSASAQQSRSYVSAEDGKDNFPCTRTQPCRTFAVAEQKTGAGGSIVVLDSGEYGPVTITKALTIDAPAGVVAQVASTGDDGITVAAGTTDVVVLRGLTVTGPGDAGIIGNTYGSLHIERCVVHGFANAGIDVWRPGKVHIKDTTVRHCGGGIGAGFAFPNLTGTIEVLVEHCRVEKTRIGGAISAGRGAKMTVRDTTVSGNQYGYGVAALGPIPAEMTVENSLVFDTAGPGVAVFDANSTMRLSNTTVINNSIGVLRSLGTIYTFSNNKIHGNDQDVVGEPLIPVAQR